MVPWKAKVASVKVFIISLICLVAAQEIQTLSGIKKALCSIFSFLKRVWAFLVSKMQTFLHLFTRHSKKEEQPTLRVCSFSPCSSSSPARKGRREKTLHHRPREVLHPSMVMHLGTRAKSAPKPKLSWYKRLYHWYMALLGKVFGWFIDRLIYP